MTPDFHLNGMDRPSPAVTQIGDWRIDPASGEIARNGATERLDVRSMRILLCLAERPGEIVSIDELLDRAWAGVAVSQDSVYQAVKSLRRILGDDTKSPKYIATIPRLGYRMVARVTREQSLAAAAEAEPEAIQPSTVEQSRPNKPSSAIRNVLLAVLAVAVVGIAIAVWHRFTQQPAADPHPAIAAAPPTSIAVMPFLDLTPGMADEEFADGVTEELIDKLSRIPGFQVPPPTSSFAFKGKQASVAEVARTLGVAYVLDGSVRKSGTWVRIDARLVRADNGFIVWSETYDRQKSDILTIQDDIAGKVTAALKASIQGEGNRGGKQ